MGARNNLLLACAFVVLVLSSSLIESRKQHYEEEQGGDGESSDFILECPIQVVKSEAGEIRALMGSHDENRPLRKHNVALGFVTMEPKALLLPLYLDSPVVFFIQQGEAMVRWIQGKKVVSKNLNTGDIYALPAGVVFYVLNTAEEQQLKIVGIGDTRKAMSKGRVQPFFVGGGVKPRVVLSGFEADVLAAAFKVSRDEVIRLFSSQHEGPIVRTTFEHFTNKGGKKDDKKHKKHDKDHKLHKDGKKHEHQKHDKEEDHKQKHDKEHEHEKRKATFDLFEKRYFENRHGWTASTFKQDVEVLDGTRIQVFAAHLNAGCMLAPHWNPLGSDFGIVTKGSGTIQVAYPNGTNAADEKLDAGTTFYVPQFLAATQIASSNGPLEFVGFTVSSDGVEAENDVQYLAGNGSVFEGVDLGILALSFGLPEQLVESFLDAQQDSIILPAPELSSSLRVWDHNGLLF